MPAPTRSAASTQMASSTPRAAPRQRSPSTARLQSFSSITGCPSERSIAGPDGRSPEPPDRAAEEDLARASIDPARDAHGGREQFSALHAGVAQHSQREPATGREALSTAVGRREVMPALADDVPAQVRHRGADLALADVEPEHVAGVGPERRRAARAGRALRRPDLVGLGQPAQPQEIVDDGVDRRPRKARHGDQLGHPRSAPVARKASSTTRAFIRRRSLGELAVAPRDTR